MKLKEMLVTELTVWEKDQKAFAKIKPEIDQLLEKIESLYDKIDSNVSEFNSPGAKLAYKNAIKATINSIAGRPRSKPGKDELKRYMRHGA